MNYFFGADVAKDNFVVAGCDANETPVIRRRSFPNSREGFGRLAQRLRALLGHEGRIYFLVEASGNLHENLIHARAETVPSICIFVVNPLVAKRYGVASLRRNRTDDDDAEHLLRMCQREWSKLIPWKADPTLESLRRLVAERHRLIKDRTREVNRLHARLHVTFPEFLTIFSDLTQCLPRAFLRTDPTPAHLRGRRRDALARFRAPGRGCHPLGPGRAERLLAAAQNSSASATSAFDAELVRLGAERLDLLHRQIAACQRTITTLLTEKPSTPDTDTNPQRDNAQPPSSQAVLAHQATLAQTVASIGPVVSACLCARAGDLTRFQSADALGAFLGSCPGRRQTGTSRDTASLTPYAPKTFRSSLYLGALSAIESFLPLKFYYHRLTDPNRRDAHGRRHPLTHKQAVVACRNRIVHWVYAVVTSNTPFDPQRIHDNCRRHFGQHWEDFLKQHSPDPQGAIP